MMTHKIYKVFFDSPFELLRSAYIARVKGDKALASRMQTDGYERVEGETITPDGREIVTIRGQGWALRPDVHAERLAKAFEDAKRALPEPETKSVVGTEALSKMTCPKCGDSLQHTAVCPKCAAGKLGYRHRYACVCGGVDLISKEAL